VLVAAATYPENLTINFSVRIAGAGASTTIIDGGGKGPVVMIPKANTHVTISKLTIHRVETEAVYPIDDLSPTHTNDMNSVIVIGQEYVAPDKTGTDGPLFPQRDRSEWRFWKRRRETEG
jgi:hypothetical protein